MFLDDFHDKSIHRIYGESRKTSLEPEINPSNIKEVVSNMYKNFSHPRCIGFHRVSNHLIENGRAIDTLTPHKKFETMGYYYSKYNDNCLLVGPMLFIGVDGYISDINSDISKRDEQSIGNINDTLLCDAIKNGGIEKVCSDPQDFFDMMQLREKEFATHKGDHLIFKENKMSYTTYEPDTKYVEEMEKLDNILKGLSRVNNYDEFVDYISSLDFSSYPEDLSQIDHDIPKELKYRNNEDKK